MKKQLLETYQREQSNISEEVIEASQANEGKLFTCEQLFAIIQDNAVLKEPIPMDEREEKLGFISAWRKRPTNIKIKSVRGVITHRSVTEIFDYGKWPTFFYELADVGGVAE